MFRKTLLLMCAGAFVLSLPARAQDEPTDPDAPEKPKTGETPGPNRFWQATLDGGHYMVALDRITAVSRHKYVLDGALIVDEVTVDTVGDSLVRFYFIAPLSEVAPGTETARLADRARELIDTAAERVGTDIHNMVVKKFPDTTHARTVEYRVMSEQTLGALYSSVRSAWESGRGRKFSG